MFNTKRNFSALAVAVSSALVLAGCGGGGGNDESASTGTAPSTFTITAMDGYLSNAQVRVDTDGDSECEPDVVAVTGAGGVVNLSAEYQDNTICITAVAGITIDESRGIVERAVELKAPPGEGERVVSPLTNLVVEQLAADDTLTVEEAKNAVVARLGLTSVTTDEVFGDYIAAAGTDDDKAKAINAIGEVLFDEEAGNGSDDLTLDQMLTILEEVSEDAQDAIDRDEIDDFSADVDIDDDGNVSVTPNSRPLATDDADLVAAQTNGINIELGNRVNIDLTNWFHDREEGNALTYEIDTSPNLAELQVDNDADAIGGEPQAAGTYTVYVYAIDSKEAQSYPVIFELTVTAPNTPPVIESGAKNNIQSELNSLDLVQNISVSETVSITGLFSDPDNDELTITVTEMIDGLSISYADDQLTFEGTPLEWGDLSFLVNANDSVHIDSTNAEFTLTITENDLGTHALEGKLWYNPERGSDDGDNDDSNDYTRVWCDTLKFENGIAYLNDRTSENRTQCSDTIVAAGNYEVVSGKLQVTWNDEPEPAELSLLSDAFANDGYGTLVKYYEASSTDEDAVNGEFTEALTLFESKADAEARIQLNSGEPEENGDFSYYLPAGNSYTEGKVSVSLSIPEPEGDAGDLDIDLYFDDILTQNSDNQAQACRDTLSDMFEFSVAENDSTDELNIAEAQYWPGEDNNDCVVDFDISGNVTEGQVLGVIARARANHRAALPSLHFNIEQNFLPEVTQTDLEGFLIGEDAGDYRYLASMNESLFTDEGVAQASLYDGNGCDRVNDVCESFFYSIDDDVLTTSDDETIDASDDADQFIYVSEKASIALTESADLVVWSSDDFSNDSSRDGWTEAQFNNTTWYYLDDTSDNENSAVEPAFVKFEFSNDNGVKTVDTYEKSPEAVGGTWSVTDGILTIVFSNEDGDAVLDRLNTTGDVVIATINDANHKPAIMTKDESLASGIYLQWKAAADARANADN